MERKTIIDKMKSMVETTNVEANREVFGYFLYGSQNYGLADENSDIDMYCITVPSYEEVLFGYNKNATFKINQNDDKNKITTKNIVDFFKELMKGNFSTIELLFTPYVIINEKYAEEWEELRNMRFSFLQGNPKNTMNSILGTAKSYLNIAKEKEKRYELNGKALANYLRTMDSADKYYNKNYTNFYELSAARSTVLTSIKNSSEVFEVDSRDIQYNFYEQRTTATSMQIYEKNKKAVVNLFKTILTKGDEKESY